MEYFVPEQSIVRRIWGRADTVLLIFAGASAEFALNEAVDWLYFTGRLPADPLGRLFTTVTYAQQIVFASQQDAHAAIDSITAIHRGVEQARGSRIPVEAYLEVLFMLIDYSFRSFQLLERPLTTAERAEVFDVFHRVGSRMQLSGLPADYTSYERMRARYLEERLISTNFSIDLFRQYRKQLGFVRYWILREAQALLVPGPVHGLLSLPSVPLLGPAFRIYKILHHWRLDSLPKKLLLPVAWQPQIRALDRSRSLSDFQPE
ncbi:MAG: oxygenase MpaB family protein [Puia sp.]|nr:oxygenase MpaB family protein [Puia sp.]